MIKTNFSILPFVLFAAIFMCFVLSHRINPANAQAPSITNIDIEFLETVIYLTPGEEREVEVFFSPYTTTPIHSFRVVIEGSDDMRIVGGGETATVTARDDITFTNIENVLFDENGTEIDNDLPAKTIQADFIIEGEPSDGITKIGVPFVIRNAGNNGGSVHIIADANEEPSSFLKYDGGAESFYTLTVSSRLDALVPPGSATLTPTPPSTPGSDTVTPTNIPTSPCVSNWAQGDANCDGEADEIDYTIWKDIFTGVATVGDLGQNVSSDFSNPQDGVIDLEDFEIWRKNAEFD